MDINRIEPEVPISKPIAPEKVRLLAIDPRIALFDFIRQTYLPRKEIPPQGDGLPPSKEVAAQMVQQVKSSDIAHGVTSGIVERAKALSLNITSDAKEAESAAAEIEKVRVDSYIHTANHLTHAARDLMEPGLDKSGLQTAKLALHDDLMKVRDEHEQSEQEKFDVLKSALTKLTTDYNQLIDLKELAPAEDKANIEAMEKIAKEKIDQLKAKLAEQEITTGSHRIFESKTAHLHAVVEKRTALLEKKFELEERISKKSVALVDRVKLWRVNSQLKVIDQGSMIVKRERILAQYKELYDSIYQDPSVSTKDRRDLAKKMRRLNSLVKQLQKVENKLAQAPSLKLIEEIGAHISEGLRQPSHAIDPTSMKALYKMSEQQLSWGQDYHYIALAHPVNWTTIHRSALKMSSSGRLYASITVLEPLKERQESGVPSGLRSDGRYHDRPANFHKTTNYLLGHEKETETSSFRGGQFPTEKAARKALTTMMRESNVDGFHINSLLTPTLSIIKPDKNLLKKHKQNIDAALKEIHRQVARAEQRIEGPSEDIQELMNKGYTSAKIQAIMGQSAMSNFGVNEGAVGEKRIFTKELRVGWHTSIGKYSNDAAAKISTRIQKKLEDLEDKLEKGEKLSDEDLRLADRLGVIVQFGQKIEEVWARNDYATAAVGNDPFKLPASMKVLDLLIGLTVYSNCMSGKDRTGEDDADAQRLLDEINMSLIEFRKKAASRSAARLLFT